MLAASAASGASAAVTVAFVGDQGSRQGARDVLGLIADEGVDLLVSQGDLGYGRGPSFWGANHDEILGDDFPVLAVVGNHEGDDWPEYKRWLEARLEKVPDLSCEGDVGVKARCTFRGITILQTAPGIHEVPGVRESDDYPGYLERELAADANAWRICSWHKPTRDMQTGDKDDATGWDVYEACRRGGAIVATAHEHAYSRTYLLSDFPDKTVVHRNDHLEIGPGRTFAFVSGLGGQSVRPQTHGGHWWASVYTESQGASHGALFCRFESVTAECWFKDIKGAVPDRFTLETHRAAGEDAPVAEPVDVAGAAVAEEGAGPAEELVPAEEFDSVEELGSEEFDSVEELGSVEDSGSVEEAVSVEGSGSLEESIPVEEPVSEGSVPAEGAVSAEESATVEVSVPTDASVTGEEPVAEGGADGIDGLPEGEEGVLPSASPFASTVIYPAPPPRATEVQVSSGGEPTPAAEVASPDEPTAGPAVPDATPVVLAAPDDGAPSARTGASGSGGGAASWLALLAAAAGLLSSISRSRRARSAP